MRSISVTIPWWQRCPLFACYGADCKSGPLGPSISAFASIALIADHLLAMWDTLRGVPSSRPNRR